MTPSKIPTTERSWFGALAEFVVRLVGVLVLGGLIARVLFALADGSGGGAAPWHY